MYEAESYRFRFDRRRCGSDPRIARCEPFTRLSSSLAGYCLRKPRTEERIKLEGGIRAVLAGPTTKRRACQIQSACVRNHDEAA